MKNLIIIILIAACLCGFFLFQPKSTSTPAKNNEGARANTSIGKAFKERESDIQVRGQGQVIKILSDDTKGSRHQRFILKLESGQTLLIAHNIDLAPRINNLKKNDTVEFYGEYEWNSKGGVIHWTHHDPKRKHAGGWLKHKGAKYQ